MTDMPNNLIDGQTRAAENPDTFQVPSLSEVIACKKGAYVKIGLVTPEDEGERFWVKITHKIEAKGNVVFTGTVENDLTIFTDHPYGSLISFQPRHVLGLL